MEDFKRPNHPDFKLTDELAKDKFSGFRHNALTDEAEIWIEGEIRARITRADVLRDPMAINKAYEQVFGLPEVFPDTPEIRAYVSWRNSQPIIIN
jgi:hypothetical protein